MTELAKTIELQAAGQHEAAVALVQSDDGFKTMNGLRVLVEQTLADEERLLLARSEASRRNDARLLAVSLAGMALVVLIGALSVFLVQRTSRQRESARNELAATNANLERIVAHRTADLTEANEEIQRFAYIVSHDLRSPLVNIMGFTSELEELRGDIFKRIEALARAGTSAASVPDNASDTAEPDLEGSDKQLSQDFTEALGFIKSSIAKMDRLISAILNLTREGRREFEPVRIDTRELIEGIAATVAHQAAEAEAQIRIEPLPDIVSDRLALEQIFSNLIDNALKYLKPGVPGDISVRGRTKLGFAIFEIADNGRGIDPKDHQRIFDLFRRAGTQDKPGQGIGLAHVRALVRRLGGTMSVASELHNGSTFTITLPINWAAGNRNRHS
jgi:signal transduction histidine kinase